MRLESLKLIYINCNTGKIKEISSGPNHATGASFTDKI